MRDTWRTRILRPPGWYRCWGYWGDGCMRALDAVTRLRVGKTFTWSLTAQVGGTERCLLPDSLLTYFQAQRGSPALSSPLEPPEKRKILSLPKVPAGSDFGSAFSSDCVRLATSGSSVPAPESFPWIPLYLPPLHPGTGMARPSTSSLGSPD